MKYIYSEVKSRNLIRIDRKTKEEDIVTVSNRNGLLEEQHIRLLNLNDENYEYKKID